MRVQLSRTVILSYCYVESQDTHITQIVLCLNIYRFKFLNSISFLIIFEIKYAHRIRPSKFNDYFQ